MATAPAERRQRSMRVRARDGMPAAVKRMQPLQATNDGVRADWACNLRLRTGWHVLKTRGHGNLFVFMIVLHNVTYYIDLGNESHVDKRPRCHLDIVCIDSLIHELAHLEALLAGDEVYTVYEFNATGVAAGDAGVMITTGNRCVHITEPVPASKKPPPNDGGEADPVVVGCDADPDEECAVVCSGDESEEEDAADVGSDTSEDGGTKEKVLNMISQLAPSGPSTMRAKPATGGGRLSTRGPPLWSNEYFTIADTDASAGYLQARVRVLYNTPVVGGGMGDAKLTKLVRPREFGEPFETPVRTLLVLRSWTVWRARHAGWACARPETSRKQIIDEEESCIERAVRALCEPCCLLGTIMFFLITYKSIMIAELFNYIT